MLRSRGLPRRRHARGAEAARAPQARAASVGNDTTFDAAAHVNTAASTAAANVHQDPAGRAERCGDGDARDHEERDAVRDASSHIRHRHQPVDERAAPLLRDRAPRDDRGEPAHQAERRHDERAHCRIPAGDRGERHDDERAGTTGTSGTRCPGRRRTRRPRTAARSTYATSPAPAGGAAGTGTSDRVSVPSAYTTETAPSASNPRDPTVRPMSRRSTRGRRRTAPRWPSRPARADASVPSQRPRPPWTTGEMVSTIDSPQGPWSADHPAIADAATSAAIKRVV